MPRILIVDDDTDLVNILSRALQDAGYETLSASEPISGFEAAKKSKPDLVILDYHMPGTTGAHLFESFRRNQSTAQTPILFMSGEASHGKILSEIAEDSRTRFLTKPAHFTKILRVIEELLPKH